jgi:hypothetical protein
MSDWASDAVSERFQMLIAPISPVKAVSAVQLLRPMKLDVRVATRGMAEIVPVPTDTPFL